MTTWQALMEKETATLYEVLWWPENWKWPEGEVKRSHRYKGLRSYVVAHSMDEASDAVSLNRIDIVRITRLGPVVERNLNPA